MIIKIIQWSVLNRVWVLLLTGLIILAGGFAIKNTAVDAIPDLSDVQVIIKTSYPGQAPQVVQDQVTYPLTTAMLSVPGAKTVRGFSFFGDSYVYIIFDDDTDLYWARSRVLEYLSQVTDTLPDSAKPQLGPDATGVGWVFIYALTDTTGHFDLAQLRSLQDWFLKFELQTVAGVSEVAAVGGMIKQYQVQADPDKLRAYGIPLSLLQAAIQQGNQEVGASVIEMAEAEYMIRATGYISSREDLEHIPLGMQGNSLDSKSVVNGQPLLLKDVATIIEGPQMRRGIAELDGKGEVVGGIVVMRSGENAQKTIEGVKAKLEQLKAGLPAGVELVTVYDRSDLITAAVNNLWEKLTAELIMVALACVIFLFHVRSALVAVITLPIGILMAFIVMNLQGLNANIMSLAGIAIAMGAMIDGAIVMIENMHKHLERAALNGDKVNGDKVNGDKMAESKRWQLVIKAASEVGPSLFFSLLIITVSFLPVFTLEAQEGKMFAPLAFTKTYAMAAAAILAITLVPVLMGYFVRGKIISEKKNPLNRLLIAGYKPLLTSVLKFPKTTLLTALIIVIATLYPASKIGSEFMPDLDEGDLMYMPTTYAALSVGKARELLQQTDKLIATVPEVEHVFGKIGRADTATDPAPLTMIETFIKLKPKDQWREGLTSQDLRNEFDQLIQFPGLTNAWVMPIKTRIDMLATGIKTPVGIKVSGPDLNVIQDIGQQLEQILGEVKGTASVYSERVVGGRYIKIDIKRRQAAQYGMSIKDVQQVVSSAIGGMNISESVEGDKRYPINLRYPQHYRDSPEKLQRLPIVTDLLTKGGHNITLGDVANIRIEDGPPMIKSENARINGWTYIDIETSGENAMDIGSYVANAKQILADKIATGELDLPSGYALRWAGQYEYMQRAKEKLSVVVPLTLGIIFLLLYLNFRNVRDVALILLTLPMGLVGGILMMQYYQFNFSVAVGVGFIALAGVAAETGVIMLQYLKQALLDSQWSGDKPQSQQALQQSILHGAVNRVRPVMMTALATIAGLIPVMYGAGIGSEVMSRIAAPMLGGMISVVILTLLVLPVAYYQAVSGQKP